VRPDNHEVRAPPAVLTGGSASNVEEAWAAALANLEVTCQSM